MKQATRIQAAGRKLAHTRLSQFEIEIISDAVGITLFVGIALVLFVGLPGVVL